jgi:hypothetical protein
VSLVSPDSPVEPEPIEQLHSLLQERIKVAERIAGVRSALGYIKTTVSTSLAEQCMNSGGAGVSVPEKSMKEEQTYERLLQALHDMKAQIEDRVRPVAEQVVEAEVERLRDLSGRHHSALRECVNQIDQSILSCRAHMKEYQQLRSDLVVVNQRLARLGAEPAAIPDELPSAHLGDIIKARVEGLHIEGKI